MDQSVNQKGARSGGDTVGRDKITYVQAPNSPPGRVESLLLKLREQVENNQEVQDIIDELARYHSRRSVDGIEGLEAKLEAGNRHHLYMDAIEKKEMFAKLLEQWSLYSSAQSIFALFLARAEVQFSQVIHPQIPSKSEAEINSLVLERIVDPIVAECGTDLFHMDHNIALGMVYWLAEQCFIRWHS